MGLKCPVCEREVPTVTNCSLCGNFHGCAECQKIHQGIRHFDDTWGEPSTDSEVGMELDSAMSQGWPK